MLFAYPASALAPNWLNQEILDSLIKGMDAIDAGNEPDAWPDCLSTARRSTLKRRTGLKKRLKKFWDAYKQLPAVSKTTVRDAIAQQTDLPGIFSNNAGCLSLTDLHEDIRKPANALGEYLFGLLTDVKDGEKCIRDVQYDAIWLSGIRVCPYCGLSRFRAPGAPRHDLDHLMHISKYPFPAADLHNLPPTCDECNKTFKRTADLLFNSDGSRRKCSNPYLGPIFSISLAGSEFFEGNEIDGWKHPRWEVEIIGPEQEQAETWDAVYKIKARYCRDVLDASFLSWVTDFAHWYDYELGKGTTPDQVAGALPRYIEGSIPEGLLDRGFLKAEALRFVESKCQDATIGDRIRSWLWDFVEYAV